MINIIESYNSSPLNFNAVSVRIITFKSKGNPIISSIYLCLSIWIIPYKHHIFKSYFWVESRFIIWV